MTGFTLFSALTGLVVVPLSIWICYTDLKFMKISNRDNIIIAVWSGICCLAVLGLTPFLWHIGLGAIVLIITYTIFLTGHLGGGDAKFLAAAAVVTGPSNSFVFYFNLSVLVLLTLLVHRIAARYLERHGLLGDWVSFGTSRTFPFGVPIALALIYHIVDATDLIF